MVQNIDDVLQRGAVLSELDTKTQNLSMLSQKYKKSATQLNRRSMYVKGAIAGIILMALGMYFWVFWVRPHSYLFKRLLFYVMARKDI